MTQVDESVYNQELHRELSAILQQLPEAEREVLTLRYFFGISYREQAEAKSVSLQSIAQRADTALERIRRNPKQMRVLSEFMPEYDFDPYHHTGLTSWAVFGQSAEEKFIASLGCNAVSFLIQEDICN